LAGIVMIFMLAAFMFLGWERAFDPMIIVEKDMGPFELVFLEHRGPYQEIGPVLKQVMQEAKDAGVEPERTFGNYLDDPKAVKQQQLRSEAGVIVKTDDVRKFRDVKGLKHRVFAKQACVTVVFPFKNTLSIYLGIFKAYPALEKYRVQMGYKPAPGMELYDSETITYIFPIVK
jgi:hypothetical protein